MMNDDIASAVWIAVGLAAGAGALVGLLLARFWPHRRVKRLLQHHSAERSSYLRGVRYLLSNDTDAAIQELTKVVDINSETVDTYFALGALFRSKGEVERAIRIHQSLTSRPNLDDDTHTRALFELGLDFRKAGFLSRALATFHAVLAKEPDHVESLGQLQHLYEDRREWEKAYEMQREIARLSGKGAESTLSHLMVEIGRTHEEAGELRDARRCYRRALSIEPASVHASVSLGALQMKTGEVEEAAELYRLALDYQPELAGVIYPHLEEAYAALGDTAAYESFLRRKIVENEDDIFARLALARWLQRSRRTRSAIEELRRALEMRPDFVEARKALGEILRRSGSAEEILQEYDELLATLVHPMRSFQCRQCGFESPQMHWKCPQCQAWDSVGFKRSVGERKQRRLRVA